MVNHTLIRKKIQITYGRAREQQKPETLVKEGKQPLVSEYAINQLLVWIPRSGLAGLLYGYNRLTDLGAHASVGVSPSLPHKATVNDGDRHRKFPTN